MKLTKDQLISAMERSYDYYSARAVLADVLDAAGLAGKTGFEAGEVERLCGVLAAHSRHAAALAAITALTGVGPAPEPVAAAPAAAAPIAPEPVAAVPVEPAPAAAVPVEPPPVAPAPVEAAPVAAAPAEPAPEKAAPVAAAPEKAAPEKAAPEKAAPKKAAKPEVVLVLDGAPQGATAVFAVGDHAALGGWKLEGGLALKAKDGHWVARLGLEPGTALEFKFAAKLADGEAWEGGENRKLTAGAGETRFEAAWQA